MTTFIKYYFYLRFIGFIPKVAWAKAMSYMGSNGTLFKEI
jgi:hypothetical protein